MTAAPGTDAGAVRLVTDSTAYLPADLVARHHLEVVALQVVVDGHERCEGIDVSSAEVAEALRRHRPVSTSRPSPAVLLETYQRLADGGAREIVSVHLSAAISGTYDAARLAAAESPVPVHVVDSRTLGLGLGFAVLAAAAVAHRTGDGAAVAQVARDRAAGTQVWFCVATLEHLRRGGRIGAAQALLGSALAVKPILAMRDGRIEPAEKVRTAARAHARLAELAITAASRSGHDTSIGIHHLAAPEPADQLAQRIARRLPDVAISTVEVGAVVGAHVGPGMLAVVVSGQHR